jgi:hypothetical protein
MLRHLVKHFLIVLCIYRLVDSAGTHALRRLKKCSDDCLSSIIAVPRNPNKISNRGCYCPNQKPLRVRRNSRIGALAPVANTPDTLKALVLMADFSHCGGGGTPISAAEMSSFVFGRNSRNMTVEGQLRYCSHGKLKFSNNSMVVVVKMNRCSGYGWSFQRPSRPGGIDASCPTDLRWAYAVEARAKQLGVAVDDYDSRWFVLDNSQQYGDGCFYNGVASFGPDGDAGRLIITSWLDGLKSNQVWQHEIGHTLGLYHSASITGPFSENGVYREYGDNSCAMAGTGNSKLPRCYNMAQSTMMAWNIPQLKLLDSTIPNQWTSYQVNAPHLVNDVSGLHIIIGAPGDSQENLFVSYRRKWGKYRDVLANRSSPFPNDSGVHEAFAGRVNIHRVSGLVGAAYLEPILVGLLNLGQTYRHTVGNINVKFVNRINTSQVSVQLCRSVSKSDCR